MSARVGSHVGLAEQRVLVRINTAGDQQRQHIETAFPQLSRILTNRNGVHVYHTIGAVVFVLQGCPVFEARPDSFPK